MFKELKRIFHKEAPVPTILIGREDISGETRLDIHGSNTVCIHWGKLCQSIEGLGTFPQVSPISGETRLDLSGSSAKELDTFPQVSPDGNYVVWISMGGKMPGAKEFGPHISSKGFNFTRWEVKKNPHIGAPMQLYQDYEPDNGYFIVKGDFRIQPLPYGSPYIKPKPPFNEKWEWLGVGGVIHVKTFRSLDREKLWPWLKDHYPPPKADYPLRLLSVVKTEIFNFYSLYELTSRLQLV